VILNEAEYSWEYWRYKWPSAEWRPLISIFVVTNCGVSLHLWFPETRLRNRSHIHTLPAFHTSSMSDHFIRNYQDGLTVIYNWRPPIGIIPSAETATAARMITDRQCLWSSSQGTWRTHVITHLKVWLVWSVTGILDSYIYSCNWRRRWRWYWPPGSSLHWCPQVKMRLIQSLGISPWFLCQIPMMTYTW